MVIALALLLASHTLLQHETRDPTTHFDQRSDVTIALDVGPTGVTTLHVTGSFAWTDNDLAPPSARPGGQTFTTRVDETWIGRATVSPSAVVVRFDSHTANGHSSAVDVAWRCELSSMPVTGTPAAVWKCAPAQNTPIPNGPLALPDYFSVPTYLAAPPVSLRVDAKAFTGADHRMNLTSVSLSR